MKVLIIEDEPITAKELKHTLRKLVKDIEILDTVDSIESAVEFLEEMQPDLIFSDIHLADGSCFEIYKKIDIDCPIIFCTAYDHYAIEAFKTNGIAYILKPFDEKMVSEALAKVQRIVGFNKENTETKSPINVDFISQLLQKHQNYKSHFLVSKAGKFIPIEANNIAFFYVKNEITMLFTQKGESFMTEYSLDNLENELNPQEFYRANRQFLIHKSLVKEVEQYFARKLLVKTTQPAPESIVVSKAKATEFVKWLGK